MNNKLNISDIKEIFKKYDIDYNIPHKILIIREPMYVEDFVYLRYLVSKVDKDIEIRVNNKGRRNW